MSIEVVVAGRVGSRIVGRLLPAGRCCSAGVRAAENRSDGIMYASSLLSEIEDGVVLVLDADTLEAGPLHEQRTTVEYLTRRSSVETGFRLVLAVPQVEAVLFHDRAGLERALGRRIADEDAFEGRFRPKAVFRRLAGEGAEHDAPFVEEDADGNVVLRDEMEERALAVIDALDEAALARMATHPIIREIAEFVAEVKARDGYQEPVPVRRAG
jgi:hypothetical protein